MARLQRSCHRLVWLNPLAGAPGYQPLAAGMQAAYPYIDDFLPAGTVASLERLGEVLAGGAPGRPTGRPHRRAGGAQLARDGGEAAAHGPRRITPNPGAGKRLGAWANTAPTTPKPNPSARPVALRGEDNPAAPRPLQ
jgi:hypothetical protein